MQTTLEKCGSWIDLDTFLKFNKINAILSEAFGHPDIDELWKALSKMESSLLSVRENDAGVRQVGRKFPHVPRSKEDEESRTIYVENVPCGSNPDVVKTFFEQYGSVVYVSLPKYKSNNMIKGFAFVEFETQEGAEKTLAAFGLLERVIDSARDPSELESVQTYIKDNEEAGENGKSEDAEKKKKKSNKKKPGQQEHWDGFKGMSAVRVMTKTNWRKMRNSYLNLQRQHMSEAKRQLRHWGEMRNTKESASGGDNDTVNKLSEIQFVPNCIVRFTQDEPVVDKEQLKGLIRSAYVDPVKYIDVAHGCPTFHVRCTSEEQARKLAKVSVLGKSAVLAGDDEQEYWNKIHQDRKVKHESKGRGKPMRGKDKLSKRIEKAQNAHVFFDIP
jgi:La-related protein 7